MLARRSALIGAILGALALADIALADSVKRCDTCGSSDPCYQAGSSCPPGVQGCPCYCRSGQRTGTMSCFANDSGPCTVGPPCGVAVLIGPDLNPVLIAVSDLCGHEDNESSVGSSMPPMPAPAVPAGRTGS